MAGTQAQITIHTRKLNGMKELNQGGKQKKEKESYSQNLQVLELDFKTTMLTFQGTKR